VVTHWNSTYDLLEFAVKYWQAIDALTADKQLKLRKYELFDDDWRIIDELVSVLQVRHKLFLYANATNSLTAI
jgi:hypothetical protein